MAITKTLLKSKEFEITVYEHSGVFDMLIDDLVADTYIPILENATQEDLCQMGKKLIIMASFGSKEPQKYLDKIIDRILVFDDT